VSAVQPRRKGGNKHDSARRERNALGEDGRGEWAMTSAGRDNAKVNESRSGPRSDKRAGYL